MFWICFIFTLSGDLNQEAEGGKSKETNSVTCMIRKKIAQSNDSQPYEGTTLPAIKEFQKQDVSLCCAPAHKKGK